MNNIPKRESLGTRCLIILMLVFLLGCTENTSPLEKQPENQELAFKNTVLSLTFDDGDSDNYAIRQDLLKNNIHATFYIVSSFIGTDGYLSETQLKDLYHDGNEIGGHTLNHTSLIALHGEALKHEICQDRLNLTAYGFNVISFAYPSGHINDEAKQAVQDCGYSSGRVVVDGPETIPALDTFALRSMPYIVGDTRLPKMQRYIREVARGGGGWVIFVFHHVCEDCDYFSISPRTFSRFSDWLGEQQKNGLVVRTIGDVISNGAR